MSNESNTDAKSEPGLPTNEPPADAKSEPGLPANEPSAPEPSANEPSTNEPPAPKKKKRKRKAAEAPAAPGPFERPALDASGRERPRFLLRFPLDPELDRLVAAFEAGNYAEVRRAAPDLAERAESPEVRRAAEELLRRIEPDQLLKLYLAVAVALLLAVASYAYMSS
jgi:hypothetical protein